MASTETSRLKDLIARQRPGWSLDQSFYVSSEVYEVERSSWLAQQWYVLGHCSEIPDPGSFIVRELLGESIIIARDTTGSLRGFYNVCRHRGSRICDQQHGNVQVFICPYHAWTYELDGALRPPKALANDIDVATLGLHPVPITNLGGVILGSLAGDVAKLEPVRTMLEPGLLYHGIPEARIAARRNYATQGNWKLVLENFIECYHCPPAHAEFCYVMPNVVDVAGRTSPNSKARWKETVSKWAESEADPESPVTLTWESVLGDATYSASRVPIGGGRKTQSKEGLPVAPLMGKQTRFDGGVGTFRFEPFFYLATLNDHAVLFQFLPTGVDSTDVSITWLVDGWASDDDVDIDRMIWLWDVTTVQDKRLIERNAAGIRSRAYRPGPYTTLEGIVSRFVSRYLQELSTLLGP